MSESDFAVAPTPYLHIAESFLSLCLCSVQKLHCMLRFHSIFSTSRPFLSLYGTFLFITENICRSVPFWPPFYCIFNVNFKLLTGILCNIIRKTLKSMTAQMTVQWLRCITFWNLIPTILQVCFRAKCPQMLIY